MNCAALPRPRRSTEFAGVTAGERRRHCRGRRDRQPFAVVDCPQASPSRDDRACASWRPSPAVALNVVEPVVGGHESRRPATGSAVGLFDDSATVLPPDGAG